MNKKLIGFYKVGKAIEMSQETDFAGWSHEPITLAKIFNKNDVNVTMLSDVVGFNPWPKINKNNYSSIILFCGPFSLAQNKNIIKDLRERTDNLILFVSDLKLVTPEYFEVEYESIFWNARRTDVQKLDSAYGSWAKDKKLNYNYCPEFSYFEDNLVSIVDKPEGRKNLVYFAGGERNRTKDFFEYVYRPDTKLHVKNLTLGYDSRVGRKEYLETLRNSKYSVVFADDQYNRNGFINTRHCENISNGVISFAVDSFDKDNILVSTNDNRRVSNYLEFRKKIIDFENNPASKALCLESQLAEIEKYKDGKIIFEAYEEKLK